LFISYGKAKSLGTMDWETPVGEVIEGFEESIKKLNSDYKEEASQGLIHSKGREYIEQNFPGMDKFGTCSVLRSNTKAGGSEEEGSDAEPNEIEIKDAVEPLKILADEKDIDFTPGRLGSQAIDIKLPLFLFSAFSLAFVIVVAKKRLFGSERRKRM